MNFLSALEQSSMTSNLHISKHFQMTERIKAAGVEETSGKNSRKRIVTEDKQDRRDSEWADYVTG